MVALSESEKRLALPEPKSQKIYNNRNEYNCITRIQSKKTYNFNKKNTPLPPEPKAPSPTAVPKTNSQRVSSQKQKSVTTKQSANKTKRDKKNNPRSKTMKARYIAIVGAVSSLFFSLLLFFVVNTADSEDRTANQTAVTGGWNVSPEVLKAQSFS